jgi:hypothetical protein
VANYPLNTYVSVGLDEGMNTTPTSTASTYVDNTGTQHTLTVPTTNGSDHLVGMWGDNGAAVYRKSTSTTLVYSDFYVCKGSDTAHQYSIFSTLNADGSIYHIEGPEDVTPALYKDNTLVMSLN